MTMKWQEKNNVGVDHLSFLSCLLYTRTFIFDLMITLGQKLDET